MAKQDLHFSITATNDDLKRKLAESRQAILDSGKTAEATVNRIDGSFKRMAASAAALGGGVALGAMANELYGFANAFDKSMREVSTISETVSADMNGFKQSVLDMTTQIPVGANDAAKALYQIISAGHDGAKGMQVLEVSAKAAIGGVTETATAADAITTVLNAYKKDSAEAESISDQLFTTVRLGKTTFGELGRSISQAVPIAASFGIETEQVLAAVATLTKSGTPTAQAMTQIRASIIASSKVLGDGYFKVHTFQEGLAEIAKRANGSEAELRKLIPEIEGINGVLGLTGLNAKTAAADLAALGDSIGATQQAYIKMKEGAEAQLTLLKNNTLKQFHEIGEGGLNVMGSLAKAMNTAFETGAIDDLVAIMGVLVATVGVYKAQLMVTNAVKLVGNNIVIAEEIKAYKALLPAKEASKNKDIEILVSKGHLSQKRAEELIAIRAQVQAQLEELKVKAQIAQAELAAAIRAEKNALRRSVAAKQSLALAQSQMNIALQSGSAEEIAAAKTAARTAKIEVNSAASARNTAQQAVGVAQTNASSAATAVDTIQTNINTAATRSATTAKNLFTAATARLTKAFHSLKLAFATNPIGMILTGVTMAISLFSMFGNSTKDAAESLSGVEKASKKAGDEFDTEAAKVKALQDVMNNSKVTYDERKRALIELKSLIPSYNAELNNEGVLINNNTEAIKAYLTQLEKQIRLKAIQEEKEAALKKQYQLEKQLKKDDEKVVKTKSNVPDVVFGGDAGIEYQREMLRQASDAASKAAATKSALELVNKELLELDGDFVTASAKLDKSGAVVTTFSDQLKNAATSVTELTTKLADLKAGKVESADFAKDIAEADKALKEAKSRYDLLRGINGKSAPKDIDSDIIDSMLRLEQMKISVMQQGRTKELAQIELTRKEKLAALDKEQKELAKKQGKPLTTEQAAGFNTERALVGVEANKGTASINKKYDDEIADHWKILTSVFLSEEQKRTGSIKDRYDKERQWADKMFSGSPLLQTMFKLQIDASQAQEELKTLTDHYQAYTDNRKGIEQKFDLDIVALRAKNKDGKLDKNIDEAERQKKEALSKVDFEEAKKGADFSQLFGNLDNLTLPSMEVLRDKIKAWIDSAGQNLLPEDFKAVMAAFQKLDLKIADKDPFGELKTAGQEYKKATLEVAQAQANLNDLQTKGITSGKQYEEAQATLTTAQNKQSTALAKQQQAINSVADKGKQILGAAQDVLGILTDLGIKIPEEIAGALDGVGQMLDGLGSMDLTKPLSIVTGAVKMLGGLVKSITSLFGGSKETMKELERRKEEYREKAYFAELEINQLYRDRYEWAQKIGESNLSYIKRQGEELKKQSTDNAKEQDDLMAKLLGADYKSGEHFEKTGLFGWGKGKIVEDRQSLSGKSWEEIEKLAASGALSAEGMKYYEALKKAREEGDDLAKRQEEYVESVRELTTGSTYEGVVNGIVEGFKAGKRSAADFADSFEGLLNGAIESALNSLANEKSRAWYEKFAEMGKDGYTEDELAELKADWIKLNEDLVEDAKNLEIVTGGTIGGGQTNENSLTGQIRGSVATEASVAELGGIFRGQYDKLSSIDNRLAIGFQDLVALAKTNAMIEANTRATAANTAQTVATLVVGFTDMQTELTAINKNTTKDTGSYGS